MMIDFAPDVPPAHRQLVQAWVAEQDADDFNLCVSAALVEVLGHSADATRFVSHLAVRGADLPSDLETALNEMRNLRRSWTAPRW